jgi:hypothetical protein
MPFDQVAGEGFIAFGDDDRHARYDAHTSAFPQVEDDCSKKIAGHVIIVCARITAC